ncbi:MAG TPA: rhodanese-like domain-containing protein [Candidatus Berkiella sp.]|nr:rhodanese-like domain-containing protein [Candidatus Berkiella sp.]
MNPLLTFFVEHWVLSGTFLAIVFILLVNEWRHRSMGVPHLAPQDLVNLLNHSAGVVVDIRSQTRFEQSHIIGAINLPQADFQGKLNTLNKYKAKPLVLVCANGSDAPKMAKILKANGFNQVYFLANGMDGWVTAGMPVVK